MPPIMTLSWSQSSLESWIMQSIPTQRTGTTPVKPRVRRFDCLLTVFFSLVRRHMLLAMSPSPVVDSMEPELLTPLAPPLYRPKTPPPGHRGAAPAPCSSQQLNSLSALSISDQVEQ